MGKTAISIIIPCRNEEKFIKGVIRSVLEFLDPDKIIREILLIDGKSSDNTRNIISELAATDHRIKLVENPHKHQSAALNIGIRQASGDYIMRLDAHAVYPADYLILCHNTAKKTRADNVGGIVFPKISQSRYCASLVHALTTHKFGVGDSAFRTSLQPGPTDTVPYGFFTKDIFERIGLFDERLVRAQDYEFNRRINAAGGTVWLNPEIQVGYFNQPTLWRFLKKMFVQDAPYNAYMWYLAHYTFAFRHAVTGIFTLGIILGGALSMVFWWARWPFLAVVGLYGLIAVTASVQQAWRYKQLLHVFLLPISFFLFHFIHGCGLLSGIIRLLLGCAPVKQQSEPWSGAGRHQAFHTQGV